MRKWMLGILLLGMVVPTMAAEKVAVLSSGPKLHGNEYQGIDKKLGIVFEIYEETPEEIQRLAKNLDSYRLILTTPLFNAKKVGLENRVRHCDDFWKEAVES